MDLCPSRIFDYAEVWRLLTPYLTGNSIWSTGVCVTYSILILFQFERRIGSVRLGLLMLCSFLANSLIAMAIDAFFGLIPGINSVPYFHDFWTHHASMGPTAPNIILTVYLFRALRLRTYICCFFRMPVWLYYLILFAMFQLLMWPLQYGIEYNAAAFCVGFVCPMQFICPAHLRSSLQASVSTQLGATRQPQHQVAEASNLLSTERPAAKKVLEKPQGPNFGKVGNKL